MTWFERLFFAIGALLLVACVAVLAWGILQPSCDERGMLRVDDPPQLVFIPVGKIMVPTWQPAHHCEEARR